MDDHRETQEQLHAEVLQLRRQVVNLESRARRFGVADTAIDGEEKYKRLVEVSPDAVVLTDLEGRVVFASEQAWELLGLARIDSPVGRTLSECLIEDDRARLAANFSNLLQTGVHRDSEYTVLRVDGATVPVETSSAVIRGAAGQPTAVMAVVRDVTQRRQVEAALRESEQRVRTICDSALDGVVMVDAHGAVLYWNPAAERIFGYSCAEMFGREVHAVLPSAEYRQRALRSIEQFAVSGRGEAVGRVLELTALRKDGTEFPIEMSVSAFRMLNQWCAAAIVRDVTERRKSREALERERRTLKHMLRASDHERQLIAYDIHDGLAQHLAGAIMQFEAFDHMKDAQPKQAADAYHAGMTMLRQGHFEARRLISGVRPPILDESGVVAAIAHLVSDQRFPGGPKIEFRSRVAFDRLIPLLENVIYRVVQEALTNACRHAKSPRVRISMVQRGEQLCLEIRDWGLGFDPKAVRENRFGLEGIRERSRVLGGRSRIRSRPGRGTSIMVDLPVVERDMQQ